MIAASLLLVLIAAKAITLVGHHVSLSAWSPAAYLWQDFAVALVFAALELALSNSRRLLWVLYGAAAFYTAINIPVARALSTPLTRSMWRAAGGALSDSMWHYVTWENAGWLAGMGVLAIYAPRFLQRTRPGPLIGVLLVSTALGPAAASRVDTSGFDRNAWSALLPLRPAAAAGMGWTVTGFDQSVGTELSHFRGSARGRNVVLVSLESTAANYLGLYGARPDVMPNLSALAQHGVVFERAYAVYPESIKGLFSILCSAYPAFASSAEDYAGLPCDSLPSRLSRDGYRTALFHSGRFGYLGMEAVIRNRGFQTLEDAGDIGGNHRSSFGVDEPATVARILQWIDALSTGQRFFVAYLPIAGHHPYETPERGPYGERRDFDRYRSALQYGDVSLGVLREGLRLRGLENNTVWVVLGDHGEAFGQHDGNYGHTFHLFEENVHVPMIVAMPGLVKAPLRSRKTVSLIDTAPTLLDLVGTAAPEQYQGHSALGPEPRMAFFFADYSLGILGLRDGKWKALTEVNSGRTHLFDLENDAGERIDVASQFPRQTEWYARNLRAWIAAQGGQGTARRVASGGQGTTLQ